MRLAIYFDDNTDLGISISVEVFPKSEMTLEKLLEGDPFKMTPALHAASACLRMYMLGQSDECDCDCHEAHAEPKGN